MSVWGQIFLIIIFVSFLISLTIVSIFYFSLNVLSVSYSKLFKKSKKNNYPKKTKTAIQEETRKPEKPKIMLASERCDNFKSLNKNENINQCKNCKYYKSYESEFIDEGNLLFGKCYFDLSD